MFMKQKILELLWIWCHFLFLKTIMTEIENMIFRTKDEKRERRQFTLNLTCGSWDKGVIDNLFVNIFRLFKAMENMRNVTDIRLIIAFEGSDEFDIRWDEVKELMKELNKMKHECLVDYGETKPELHVTHSEKFAFRVVISNKHCKINGYSMYHSLQCSIR